MSQSSEPFDPYYQWLGIPPDEQPPNHYRLLGIQLFEENREVIQHAADRQMVHLRSFQNGPRAPLSQKLLNEVAAAKLCLLSLDRKSAYDAALEQASAEPPAVPPPITLDTPADSSSDITFGGTPGTLTATSASRAARFGRGRRRRSLLPWFLALIVVMPAGLGLWAWWSDQFKQERLVLVWPESMRAHASLEIDGKPSDLERDPVARSADELEFTVTPGHHQVRIARPGCPTLEESVETSGGVPTRMIVTLGPAPPPSSDGAGATHPAAVGRFALRWPLAARAGASLEIDGRVIELNRRPFSENPDTVEAGIKAGDHTLRAILADGFTVERSFSVEPEQRWELTVATDPVRLVLQWPVADRDKATLEIDGRGRDLAADSVAVDDQQVVMGVQPGSHTVRISRPGYDEFRTEVNDMQEEKQIDVTWTVSAIARPAGEELEKLHAEFKKVYEKSSEYEKWAAEKDSEKKRELLKYLLARLETEAKKLPKKSDQQWAAYDEALQLALTAGQFVQAYNLVNGSVGSDLFSDAERQSWESRIWDAALQSDHMDDLADYLKLSKAAGRVPAEAEQAVIAQRFAEAAADAADFADLVARVVELEKDEVLTSGAALHAQLAVYKKVAEREMSGAREVLDLCDRMFALIPRVFESGWSDAARQVDALVDTISSALRRKSMKEARADEQLRLRLFRAEEGIKLVREWASQFQRVQTARQAIADGKATSTEHKLVAFWLLQLGQFREALPHLRNTDEEGLTRIGQPLPETAKELAVLATEVDQEAKKSKYSRRQEEALRGFARFLRQEAFAKDDGTLQPAERVDLQKKLSAVEVERNELENRRFPKDKWSNLADLTSSDELRARIEDTGHGSWSLLEDGSIATNGKGTTALELPVALHGSYGVRFVCRRIAGSDVNVHLPLGDTAVVLTLGGAGNRFSGLQLVDGRDVADALNPTRIPRAESTVVNGTPLAVEIQVNVTKAESQSSKERKQTDGRDWATVKVALSGKKTPVVRSVSMATSAFSPPQNMETSANTLGLSTHAEAVYANLQLMRH
jgi:hypothetical protein